MVWPPHILSKLDFYSPPTPLPPAQGGVPLHPVPRILAQVPLHRPAADVPPPLRPQPRGPHTALVGPAPTAGGHRSRPLCVTLSLVGMSLPQSLGQMSLLSSPSREGTLDRTRTQSATCETQFPFLFLNPYHPFSPPPITPKARHCNHILRIVHSPRPEGWPGPRVSGHADGL